ncbi:hypothetical protein Sgleb_11000 [Streptomyces glebosus]|uniref:Uncharacterized protein n=1 Tax=Streptomyces glebosus TaxID=249580 RepID=A0A640SNI7_9ACTN|nr:hypothetical protein Sgleb_11000 [Streptomyces glebosus]GHG56668.1 hypothetical protein GCM10010513_19410 [Streptomyces glebosus]
MGPGCVFLGRARTARGACPASGVAGDMERAAAREWRGGGPYPRIERPFGPRLMTLRHIATARKEHGRSSATTALR